MKKTKNIIISVLLSAFAVCLGVALLACGKDDASSKSSYGYGEEGWYYYEAVAGEEYLMSLQSGTYMISEGTSNNYAGTYSYVADENAITFKTSDGETFEAAFADDAMQLSISGTPYTFLRRVEYTVKFMDGSVVAGSQSVVYGKAASPEAAEKDGYIFLGWYLDQSFGTKYTFDTAVTGDLTLYARYVEINPDALNFEVKFVSGGDVIYSTTTQNGVVYDFPDGKEDGWWVSATGSADELTYRYDGEILRESTTLYEVEGLALGVSVYADKVTWEASLSSAAVYVDGEAVAPSVTTGYFSYDFEGLSAGRHEITVSSGSMSETRVYVSHALARVSNFSVYGTTLVYNAVEDAQYYYISVTCANPAHDHAWVYNGNTLTYDFSNCEMGAGGITFTVYAYGTGYETSVSETFVYLLKLDTPEVRIDSSKDAASWTAVAGATGYEIYISVEGEKYVTTTRSTGYSLKNYGQKTIYVSVKAMAPGYWSEASEEVFYTKVTLPAPKISGINEYTVSWDSVDDATGYVVYVNGKQFETVRGEDTSVALMDMDGFEKADSYVITVKAINSENTNQNSQESDPVYATDGNMSALLVYEDRVVYWQYAMAVGTYYVTVNDGDETAVEGKNSFPVTFTKSGENVIKVYFKTEEGKSAVASLAVTAYAVIFDSRGGSSVDTIYVAKGDTLNLKTPEFTSGDANFAGWYTLPDLVGDYDSDRYLGDGYIFESGSVFDKDSTLILYASWLSIKYITHFDPGVGAVTDEDGEEVESTLIAKNSTTFTLPVPVSDDVTYVFVGWYSGPGGTIKRYTDELGNALTAYDVGGEATLYAYWVKVIDFTLSTYNGQQVLSAYATSDVSRVAEVTVPATYVYNGTEYPVALIGSSAFSSCYSLVTINIPDTIQNISLSNNGYSGGTGAFSGSASIKNVNVYETGEEPDPTKEITYYSEDGVLFRYNSVYGYVELLYYPQGRTEESYTIPSEVSNSTECDAFYASVTHEVKAIAAQVFYMKNAALKTVIIPNTVTTIETYAFYHAYLTTVTFEGGSDEPLTLGNYVFQSSDIVDISLPARLVSLDANAFTGCTSLQHVYVEEGSQAYADIDGVLTNATKTELIYYPVGRQGAYTVPNSIVTIGKEAFYNATKLTGVTIASSVTKIDEKAFYRCSGLRTLEFEGGDNDGVLYIETLAFGDCTALSSVTLPTNLRGLAAASFGGCTMLTTVTYDSFSGATSNDLSGLKAYAFSPSGAKSANSYVVTLNLGANVPEIDFESIFGGSYLARVNVDSGNAVFTSIDGVVFDKDVTSIYCFPAAMSGTYEIPGGVTAIKADSFSGKSRLTAITIPASVTSIAANAFMNCTGLRDVTFVSPDGGESEALTIGENAFNGCSALLTITLPARLTSLGTNVFGGCTALQSIEVEEGSVNFMTSYGVLYAAEGGTATRLIACPINNKETHVVIESSITSIDTEAFEGNRTVTEISFTNEVDPNTFGIGAGVFSGCTALKKITLPSGITTIEESTFEGCSSLAEIIIPASVTKIEASAFYGCTSLSVVTFAGERDESDKLVIEGGTSASGSGTAGAFGGCTSLEMIGLPTYSEIGAYTFYGCTALTEITLSVSMTSIPQYTFYNCSSLSRVEVLGAISSIGGYAFYGCSSLTSFDIPEGVTSLGDYVFANTGLTEINFPSSLTSITTKTFDGCTSLVSMTVTDGNTAFGVSEDGVLYGLTGGQKTELWIYPKANKTTSIQIPSTVTTIKAGAFTNSNIENIEFVGNFENLTFEDSQPFQNCENLNQITLPEGMTELTTSMFMGMTFKSIVIPSTITTIGNQTFRNCTELETVEFAGEGGNALVFADGYDGSATYGTFTGCTSLKSLVLPDRTTKIGSYMCYYCKSLEYVYIGPNIGEIPEGCFLSCPSLTGVNLDCASSLTSIGNEAFSMWEYSEYVTGELVINLPNTVTQVGQYVFANGCGLKEITFGAGITKIDFISDCPYLEAVKIPSQITSVSLSGCTGLKSVTFEEGSTPLTISFYGCTSLEVITIPARTSSIAGAAFSGCTSLKEITFEEESILGYSNGSIGSSAFMNTAIKKLELPETSYSYSVGSQAFSGVTLDYLYISSSVTNMDSAFKGCNGVAEVALASGSEYFELDGTQPIIYLKDKTGIVAVYGQMTGKYELPGTITSIAANAFQNQTMLEKVIIPAYVTSIGDEAFSGCTSLVTVGMLAGTDMTMGSKVFQNCESLEAIDCQRVTSFGTYAFSYCTSLSEITLSNSLGSLSNYMFEHCTSLKEIDLPDSISFMGTYTFQYSGLESIKIPANVQHFGASSGNAGSTTSSNSVYLFYYCTSLVKVELPAGLVSIGTRTFYNCSSLCIVTYTGDTGFDSGKDYSDTGYTAWPSTLTTIGYETFRGCGFIQLTVPYTTSLGDYSFTYCEKMTTLRFADGVTSTGSYMFEYAYSLTDLDITGITSLGKRSFDHCTSLTSVDLSGVTELKGDETFQGCTSLVEVVWSPYIQTVPDSTFWLCSSLSTIKNAEYITTVENKAFMECSSLTDFSIFSSLTTINAAYAFGRCGFTSLDLSNITSIPNSTSGSYKGSNYAFAENKSLESVIWSETLIAIPGNMFRSCTALRYINIPDYVTEVDTYAFYGCSSLVSLDLTNVTTLDTYAFTGCTSLVSVDLSPYITSIPNYMFQNCSSLVGIDVPGGVQTIGNYAFDGCSSLERITVPYSVTSVGTYCFQNCTSLVEASILANYSAITDHMFAGCTSLETVQLSDAVETINASAFSGCTSLMTIYISSGVTSVKANAFEGWTEEQTIYIAMTEADVASKWTSGWDTGCDATIVYSDSGTD